MTDYSYLGNKRNSNNIDMGFIHFPETIMALYDMIKPKISMYAKRCFCFDLVSDLSDRSLRSSYKDRLGS